MRASSPTGPLTLVSTDFTLGQGSRVSAALMVSAFQFQIGQKSPSMNFTTTITTSRSPFSPSFILIIIGNFRNPCAWSFHSIPWTVLCMILILIASDIRSTGSYLNRKKCSASIQSHWLIRYFTARVSQES